MASASRHSIWHHWEWVHGHVGADRVDRVRGVRGGTVQRGGCVDVGTSSAVGHELRRGCGDVQKRGWKVCCCYGRLGVARGGSAPTECPSAASAAQASFLRPRARCHERALRHWQVLLDQCVLLHAVQHGHVLRESRRDDLHELPHRKVL